MRLFLESVRLALASIRANKLRSFLTLIGVIFGVVTVCGGMIGLLLAHLIKWILVTYTSVPASVPFWAVAAALLVSSGVGIVFGICPAWKAARLDPVGAMRAE
jgi:putative ABC transport system permease protein